MFEHEIEVNEQRFDEKLASKRIQRHETSQNLFLLQSTISSLFLIFEKKLFNLLRLPYQFE